MSSPETRTISRSRSPYCPYPSGRISADPDDLPTVSPKATDYRSFSGTATTQGEALPPDILAAIVREAIEAHRDREVRRQALAREEAEHRAIRERLGRRSGPGELPGE